MKVNKITESNLPPRLTNILQPADVCWFRGLKKSYTDRWNRWFLYEDTTYTVHGNARSPGYANVIKWLSEIWNTFPNYLLKNSFDYCGITSRHVNDYHLVLKSIIQNNIVQQNYIDDLLDEDEMEGFDDELFQDIDNDDGLETEVAEKEQGEDNEQEAENVFINDIDPETQAIPLNQVNCLLESV